MASRALNQGFTFPLEDDCGNECLKTSTPHSNARTNRRALEKTLWNECRPGMLSQLLLRLQTQKFVAPTNCLDIGVGLDFLFPEESTLVLGKGDKGFLDQFAGPGAELGG